MNDGVGLSSPRGDELALAILASLPDVLAPDGKAVLRFDMADDGRQLDRIEHAVGADLDVAVLTAPGGSADLVAAAYAALADPSLGERYADLAACYQLHLAAAGITDLCQVVVVARHQAAPQGGERNSQCDICRTGSTIS